MPELILKASPEAVAAVMKLFGCSEEKAKEFLAAICEISSKNENDAT